MRIGPFVFLLCPAAAVWFTVAQAQTEKSSDIVYSSAMAGENNFMGKSCTSDCVSLRAGYEWALRQAVETPDQCAGESVPPGHEAGCRLFVETWYDDISYMYLNDGIETDPGAPESQNFE